MATEVLRMESAATEGTITKTPARNMKRDRGKKAAKSSKRRKAERSLAATKAKKPSQRMMKVFKRRAKEYNSDSDGEEEEEDGSDTAGSDEDADEEEEIATGRRSFGKEMDGEIESGSEEEEEERGITKFVDGCRAFRVAFAKIMKKTLPNDSLGPILSAHKSLVAEKLAEEVEEHKAKGEARKEKQLVAEKGHIKPEKLLDAKEKYLISVATKGVVKLFNAVNKAQIHQRDLNPSKTKDAKVLARRRKAAFLSELQRPTAQSFGNQSTKKPTEKSSDGEDDEGPGRSLLRDTYMLANPKLKDWDKMEEPDHVGDADNFSSQSSSDEE